MQLIDVWPTFGLGGEKWLKISEVTSGSEHVQKSPFHSILKTSHGIFSHHLNTMKPIVFCSQEEKLACIISIAKIEIHVQPSVGYEQSLRTQNPNTYSFVMSSLILFLSIAIIARMMKAPHAHAYMTLISHINRTEYWLYIVANIGSRIDWNIAWPRRHNSILVTTILSQEWRIR